MVSPSVRFGRVPPYRMLRLRQQAQSFIQDVFRGVDVPVVDSSAVRASPLPGSQVLGSGPLSTADGAELAGREEAVYGDHLFPVPRRLILQLPPELAPGGIQDRPGQLVVLDHVLRSQVLNADQIVVPDKLGRQLVEHILPLIGNMFL